MYRNAIGRARDTFGEWGETTLDVKAGLAGTMEHLRKHDEALLFVLELLEKSKACFGTSHPVCPRVGARAAAICFQQENRAEAIALSNDVVQGNRALFELIRGDAGSGAQSCDTPRRHKEARAF